MRLNEKVAIITGAANGIGKAIATLFAEQGAKVVVTDIDKDNIEKLVSEIIESGGEVVGVVQDVSQADSWKKTINKTISTYGSLHILVNNAGIASPMGVEETTLEQWKRTHEVNTEGVFLGMKYAVPELRKSGGGSIINISSMYAIIGRGTSAAYSASKGAIRSLSKTAAVELAKDFIRVNSIHPGVIVTDMTKGVLEQEDKLKELTLFTPWPEFGVPEDIAYGAIYLASDESKFVTATELIIDGGYVSQ